MTAMLPCLGPSDPPAVATHNPRGRAPAVIVCDHASAATPASLGNLGLPAARFEEHIALDIGAAPLARELADRLDAPLVISGYSRLVIDVNRFPDNPASVPAVSDHVIVPGNGQLSAADREARRREIFWPYHNQVTQVIDNACTRANEPAIIAVHTFTPEMDGCARPWQVGILSNQDRRLADPLIAALRGREDLCVGDNRPYSAVEPLGFTMVTHCEGRNLPHALIEVRQDEVSCPEGVVRWAEILESSLRLAVCFD